MASLDRLDRYMLRLLAGPFALVLATVLVTQILERVLRLLDLVAASGAPLSAVATMIANLVPHYLGLALPAAFTAAMFLTVARLSDDSELDVMLAMGRSMARVAMPYFALSLLLGAAGLYLYGYQQPLSRYAYRAAAYDALQTRWEARLEDRRFVSAGGGFTLSVDSVEPGRVRLNGVFLQRLDGRAEETTLARDGSLVPSADGTRLVLALGPGVTLREDAKGKVSVVRFGGGTIAGDFTAAPAPFRARGNSVRELTLPELWEGMRGAAASLPREVLAGEFHGRLAHASVLPLLPLLAVPLGMASKRRGRAGGLVFTFVALVALNHGLNFGESLAERARADALVAVWTPLLAFALFGLWLFRSSLAWPGDNVITRAVFALEHALEGIARRPSGSPE